MPGCEKLELVDSKLVGEMVIKVGPISGKFSGTVAFEDKQEPASYKMNVDGKGGPGFVKATATITLAADGDGTRLTYDADAQIGGKLATVGARLVDASAKAITKQSLDNLGTNIAIRIANRGAAKPVVEEAKPAETVEEKPAVAVEPAVAAASEVIAAVAEAPAKTTRPELAPKSAPKQAYVKADAKAMAKTAAKAATAAMLPYLLVAAVAIAAILWLILR
jgi:carbon monoxide dehydrogenase subunit G